MKAYPDFTFAHTGLNVINLEETTNWYVENLNLTLAHFIPGDMSFLADPTGRIAVEFYNNKRATILDFQTTHFLTLHLAFIVENPEETAERLIAAYVSIVDPHKETASGDRMIMLKNSFGLSIQFIKRKKPLF